VSPVADDELLRNAVHAYLAVQRQLLAALEGPGRDVSGIAAAMAAELDQLEATVSAADGDRNAVRHGDPGE
jgi:hypothetical protein